MAIDPAAIEQALSRGEHARIGQYRYDLSSECWWWSDDAYTIHGFQPGEIVPTTALVRAHKHPDDRDRVRLVLEAARATGAPFTSVHRIVDARGRERTLTVIGQGRRDRATNLGLDDHEGPPAAG